MRLLPVGPHHVRLGAPCQQPASDGFGHRRRDVRQYLSLWYLCPHSRGDQRGRAIERTEELKMILDHLSRRNFLQAGAAAGGGLLLSLRLPLANAEAEVADADGFTPNAFIRIGGDGQIVLTMPYVEMGQGTYTSIPMLIAEELEVDLKQCGRSMLRATKSSTAILYWAASRQPATQTQYARRGSRCGKPVRSREPCSCRRQQSAGMSIRRPAARKAVKCFTRRRGEAPNMASLPLTPPACQCSKAWRSSGRSNSGSSAPRLSGSMRRQRSTGRPSMASTLDPWA